MDRRHRYASLAVPTTPHRSLIPIEVAAAALLAVAATWVIASPGSVPGWEGTLFERINGLPDWLFAFIWTPMQLGSLIGALVVTVGLFAAKRKTCALTYVVATGVAFAVALAVKEIVARQRPLGAGLEAIVRGVDASGFGFISGHTAVAFAGATVMWVFYGRRWGTLAYLIAMVVGLARVYVGAHLPLDVIGGAATGALIGGAVTWVELTIASHRHAHISQAGTAGPG